MIEVSESEIQSIKTIDNPFYQAHQPGQVPGFITEQGAEVMLSGGMGARAIRFINQIGIQAATGANGAVKDAIAHYLQGNLSGAAPCQESIDHGHG
jgi:predicted Fe-Mo cluster-binding NifX family protein